MFKGRVKHHRTVRGTETFGEHHFFFSDAADDRLEHCITPEVETALAGNRQWTIAAHDGVLYLCCGDRQAEPHAMEAFLREGEELLRAFLRAADA